MAQLLRDPKFHEYCRVLKVGNQRPNDPERRVIEKSFRRLALKTHPDKGGDPVEFKLINEAYKGLISHITRLEVIEAESKLSNESVIIEISKQALPKWWEKLNNCYGKPKTANVANVIFQGPYKQYKSASWQHKSTGPINIVVYEDPEDKIPKIHVRCDHYMIWIQEQKMPLHLHVQRGRQISFDQWRIMSLAEFGFVSLTPGQTSARHDWKDANTPKTEKAKSKRQQEREAQEAEKRSKEAEDLAAKEAAEQAANEAAEAEELARKRKEEELSKPWWHKYGGKDWHMGETTPPPEEEMVPEDNFPKVFSMTSNSYTKRGLNKSQPDVSKSRSSLNSEEEENKPPAAKKEKEQRDNISCDTKQEGLNETHIPKPHLDEAPSVNSRSSCQPDATVTEPLNEIPISENNEQSSNARDGINPRNISDENLAEETCIPGNNEKENLPAEGNKSPIKSDTKDANVFEGVSTTPMEDVEKPDNDISNKTKGARRDLGSVAEKLIGKGKIKKIKSKKATNTKKAAQPLKPKSDENISDAYTSNIENNPENLLQKEESCLNKSEVNEEPMNLENHEHHLQNEKTSNSANRKRHLEASTENLDQNKTALDASVDGDQPLYSQVEPTTEKLTANGGEAKRNHIERILSEIGRRNSEILDTLTEIKTVMADACKVINKLKIDRD